MSREVCTLPHGTKRRYRSKADAAEAHQHAGYRLRHYRCRCGGWHTTNMDKHGPTLGQGSLVRKVGVTEEPAYRPWEEVEAEAARKRALTCPLPEHTIQ